ncbi:phosphoenolpyruvate carboxylase [Emcibacter nanhaiensis]
MDSISGLVAELSAQGLVSRGRRSKAYLKETGEQENRALLRRCFLQAGTGLDFDAYQALVGREIAGIVVTGHPTFGFSHEQYSLIAGLIDGSVTEARARDTAGACNGRPDQNLSLEYEFDQAEKALLNLQRATAILYEEAAGAARELFPEDWKKIDLKLITAASWVGFDVDGRDDITWMTSVSFRHRMASLQCQEYVTRWNKIRPEGEEVVTGLLDRVAEIFAEDVARLTPVPDTTDAVRSFARYIVESRAETESILPHILSQLDKLIAKEKDEAQVAGLIVFRGLLNNFRTGVSHIHFRLNSVQLHNAIRPLVALEKDPDDPTGRRRYMKAASKLLDHMQSRTIGYESILHEQTTARRLFMIIAQILKYIDPETPIRFLIAESDTPFTVLAALCYARMFGVDHKVDISPLFETDLALARGAEVIEELLENPHYFAYVKKRKRLCVQAGYSDAGRYLGQVAAGLAIERLRIKLIKLWDKFDLEDVELVIFDTGGESLGRGAHPGGFGARLDYYHSPEARRLIAERAIAYKQEISLQGGDGYLWLQTPGLALATVTRIMENLLAPVEEVVDPFYENTDWSLDFFMTVKGFNNEISANRDFLQLISLLGTDISYPSGSRMTLRQDEGVVSRPLEKLSQVRAIPNNMLLHQLGCLANSVGGVGAAIFQDDHGFWKMYDQSPRLRHLMTLVLTALDLSDEDFLGAYTSLFRPRYWMHSARYEEESHDHDRMLRLAKMLETHGVYEGLNRIELTLREDLMYLRDAIADREMPPLPYERGEEERTSYILLHVLRMTLVQKIFLLITRIPRFRDHKGHSVDDLVLGILRFQVEPTLELLREIFPLEGDYDIDPLNPEKITYKGDNAHGYEYENREIFDEIGETYSLVRQISQALTGFVGALG